MGSHTDGHTVVKMSDSIQQGIVVLSEDKVCSDLGNNFVLKNHGVRLELILRAAAAAAAAAQILQELLCDTSMSVQPQTSASDSSLKADSWYKITSPQEPPPFSQLVW